MRIRGRAAVAAARRRLSRAVNRPALNRPAFGLAVITPLVFAGAVGGSGPLQFPHESDTAVTPLAAVSPEPVDRSGPTVVALQKKPAPFHFVESTVAAPPPAAVVNTPGTLGIPAMALRAYRNAERMMAHAQPECGVSWNLLAGIGRIESMHAYGGATDANGTAIRPILGPLLDGSLPGNEIIVQSRTADRVTYARALGPMQFLPGTWARFASDGDGDGKADVQNLFDSTLAAARYLCSGGMNLRDPSHVMQALLRYNNSVAYAHNVMGWAAAYATGVHPVDLPPLTGPVPSLNSHVSGYDGLGPGSPLNAMGLSPGDPLAVLPLIDGRAEAATRLPGPVPGFAPNQELGPLPGPAPESPATPTTQEAPPWVPPWMQPPEPECVVFCLKPTAPPAPPLGQPAPPQVAPAPPAPGPAPEAPPEPGPALADPAQPPAPGPAPDPAPAAVPGPGH